MNEITKNRFVAVLDIIGFKDRVTKSTHDEMYSNLESLSSLTSITNKSIDRTSFKNYNPVIYNFSDTFYLFSTDESTDSFDVFLTAVQTVFLNTINNNFMIKGVIGFGRITINEEKRIYFGQPIIDAYLLQEEVKYMGVVFHHLAESQLKKIGSPNNAYRITNLKSFIGEKKIEHLNLLWFAFKESSRLSDIEEYKYYIENMRETCSGLPRRYIDNTIEIMNIAKDSILSVQAID